LFSEDIDPPARRDIQRRHGCRGVRAILEIAIGDRPAIDGLARLRRVDLDRGAGAERHCRTPWNAVIRAGVTVPLLSAAVSVLMVGDPRPLAPVAGGIDGEAVPC